MQLRIAHRAPVQRRRAVAAVDPLEEAFQVAAALAQLILEAVHDGVVAGAFAAAERGDHHFALQDPGAERLFLVRTGASVGQGLGCDQKGDSGGERR